MASAPPPLTLAGTSALANGHQRHAAVQSLGGGGFLGQGRQEGKKREHGEGPRGYGAVLFIKENQTMQALN